MIRRVWMFLAWLQWAALIDTVVRLCRTAVTRRTLAKRCAPCLTNAFTVIVPVLNERARLAACLEGLVQTGDDVAEILVVDGGSTDGTDQLVHAYAARDHRIHLVSAAPIPPGWNGKSWGLEVGWRARSPSVPWVLTVDADVRPSPEIGRVLLATARRDGLQALSIGPQQSLAADWLSWILHPAMLASLVYRFGIPGFLARRPSDVLANGQVMLVHKEVLAKLGGFAAAAAANAEDVALARRIVRRGWTFGFYEAGEVASVQMYSSGIEVWRGWPRSLALADEQSRVRTALQLLLLTLSQGLPGPLCLLAVFRRWIPGHVLKLNLVLLSVRLGILLGIRRAYPRRRWWYWLSPIADLPVVLQIWRHAWRRRQNWRGRTFDIGGLR